MSVIIVDGPEKAGKTTMIKRLKSILEKGIDVDIVKWGPISPDDRVYSDPLQTYSGAEDAIAIWDRGWPSEYVYGNLLNRKRRMSQDPWLGAWLHDRAVQSNGLRVMMLGPSPEKLASLRDRSDIAVDPKLEIQLFKQYAMKYGWMILEGYDHTEEDLKQNVRAIITRYQEIIPSYNKAPLPPSWAGSQNADVVFVGNELSEFPMPGGWLPFTSLLTTKFGRIFGDQAMTYAWTNARSCNPAYLRERRVIIACGNVAHLWVRNYIDNKENKDQQILYIPHPSYLMRFNTAKVKIALEATIKELRKVLDF